MRQKRVGVLSMALALIGLGVLIFVSQFNKISAVELGVRFWPVILFLIGGEILWYSYKYRDEDRQIKYDIFSIFIVFIIIVTNLGLYGLIEIGIMDKTSQMLLSQTFSLQIPTANIKVQDNIKRIVVNPPNNSNLTIRTEKSDTVTSTGLLKVVAHDKKKAKELLNNEYVMSHTSGESLYISFLEDVSHDQVSHTNLYGFQLIVPDNTDVEINGGSHTQVFIDNINANWVVDGLDQIDIRLLRNLDVTISALVEDQELLDNNTGWEFAENLNNKSSGHRGELIYGTGKNKISILDTYEITVKELE